MNIGSKVFAFFFEPSSAVNLGVCRVFFYGFLFFFYLGRPVYPWGTLNEMFWLPIPLFEALRLPLLPEFPLKVLYVAWLVSLFLSCLGLWTRVSTAAAFFLGFYCWGLPQNFGKIQHNDAILLMICLVMAVARCGDRCSVDRVVFRRKPEGPSGEYTWPVRLAQLLMVLVYFGAGMSKLRVSGLAWIFSDNMANNLAWHHFTHPVPFDINLFLARHDVLSKGLAFAAVAFQTGAPLALFCPRSRILILAGLVGFQLFIGVFLGEKFYEFVALLFFWVPWDRLRFRTRQIFW